VGNRRVDKRNGEEAPSLVDEVHAAVREAILSGEYAPGARLLVSKIAEESGASPIPVREALRRLEGERLVFLALNRGATVASISADDLRDVFETRIIVEGQALRRALPRLSAERLDEAHRVVADMTRLLHEGREREAYERQRAFYFSLYDAAGSPWSVHLIAQLWTTAERYLRLSARLRDSPEELAAEHEAVLEALRAGDADLAVQRLTEHLRRTAALVEPDPATR
jgi:DNA-binding GntR family transcriptional regulator